MGILKGICFASIYFCLGDIYETSGFYFAAMSYFVLSEIIDTTPAIRTLNFIITGRISHAETKQGKKKKTAKKILTEVSIEITFIPELSDTAGVNVNVALWREAGGESLYSSIAFPVISVKSDFS